MKNLFLLCLLTFTIFSCGSDSDCVKADFLGSYTGSAKCTGEDAVSVTAEITEGSGNTIALNIDGEISELVIDGCSVEIPETTIDFFGDEITTSGDGELDGNMLTINQSIVFIGITTNCTVTLTK